MYPLSHIYVSSKILGRMNSHLALGSVLPDVLVGSGMVWRKAHHSTGSSFRQYLATPDLRIGAALHGIDLPGLDYFSDVSFGEGKGYAYQKAVHIAEDMVRLGVAPEHALWRGHNFVEMAIEIALNRQHTHLWHYLAEAQKDPALMTEITQLAESLDATRPEAVPLVLNRFLTIRGQQDRLAQDYATKLNQIYSLALVPAQIEEVIIRTAGIIALDYQEFLDRSIHSVREALAASRL